LVHHQDQDIRSGHGGLFTLVVRVSLSARPVCSFTDHFGRKEKSLRRGYLGRQEDEVLRAMNGLCGGRGA
jgi:hypothetical protein